MLKRCSKCKEFKSATLKYFAPNSRTTSGLQSWCRRCKAIDYKRYRKTDNGKRARRNAKRSSKPRKRKKYYGMTVEQRKKLYLRQNGCCKICNIAVPYDKIVTDHNHKTGKVRSLLCRCCNTGIGMLKDDASIVQSAVFYLRK